MDGQQIKEHTDLLSSELLVGGILFKKNEFVTVDQISTFSVCSPYSKNYISDTLRELVSFGVVTCKLQNKSELSYKITEFGVYYFKELGSANTDVVQLLSRIGSEI
jgi:hypothetical protein